MTDDTPAAPPAVQLRLLGGFALTVAGRLVDVPPVGQRLVAFLAVRPGPQQRQQVAEELWPDVDDRRAGASLRSALWRVNRLGRPVVAVSGAGVALHHAVAVDAAETERVAYAVLDGDGPDLPVAHLDRVLRGTLLPGWPDEWLAVERQRLHLLRLQALEGLSRRRAAEERFGQAVPFGLTAVAVDPLSESAHRTLVEALLAAGHHSDALRRFEAYRRTLAAELGVRPSASFARLVGPIAAGARAQPKNTSASA